ncbi:glycosyltransferase family 2 protein [Pontibacter lucknowensis]|uniref:Glycosyltransferase involved in cell wall bisynthesis n=1 Tax=Pontibacter lucknowensis TaxID=1077936 RepID=A0A1N7AZ81_9BACT|nr:glycosyltransferase [Pontibacter lucknowensis]SIR44457.1 Glycosyltransferase involved in cell wall bisynthesis [Pontibacter lucknowensis]
MLSIPPSPPQIAPLQGTLNRPTWSVMIPVYNCAIYLKDTLNSVLAQGIPEAEMQIEVVDDASTDADIEKLVAEVGQGRIQYFKQEQNVGSLRNFETCINRSRGKLVHLLHGDDKVRPGYYTRIEQLFEQFPSAGAAFSGYCSINEQGQVVSHKKPEMKQDGILPDWLARIGEKQLIQYAAMTVRREVYEQLGAFYGVNYGEDWEMWVRIARHYPTAYTPLTLAEYRQHSTSITSSKFLKGEHLQDLYKAMQLIQTHLPEDQKHTILQRSKKHYATYALNIAARLWHSLRNEQLVEAHIKNALRFHNSPLIYLMAAKLYFTLKFSRI